jgi:glycosyltransferase involved in cell wall biosynthesis
MNLAINYRVQEGPWGGGNRFVANLITALEARGDTVTDRLEPGTDLVLMIDPRRRNPAVTFTPGAILRHLARHPETLVVHRINECDERKGTTGMNRRLKRANYAADHSVFVAQWLRRDLAVWHDKDEGNSSVILNGADAGTFHPRGHVPWTGEGPLRLVTHHWGGNWMKGFDVYQRLDAMLAEPGWRDRIAFTYIGNLPPGFRFKNATYMPPLDGAALADALRGQHAYVTASRHEPGSNHQNEGALCGLPVLYIESGALPEYCTDYGIGFTPETFVAALEEMLRDYGHWSARMADYPHVATRTTARYLDLFDRLAERRTELAAQRRLFRDPLTFLANQLAI